MSFKDEYTTQQKVTLDGAKKPEEQTGEANKIVLSNDAYAVGSLLELIFNKLEHLRISNYK